MKLMGQILTSPLLAVVCFGGMAFGQVTTSVIKASIPFEFSVGGKTFAPGEYSLTQPLQNFLVLRDARGQTVASAFTSGVEVAPPATPKLRFASVSGKRVLVELWQEKDPSGQRLISSKPRSSVAEHRSLEARETAEGGQP